MLAQATRSHGKPLRSEAMRRELPPGRPAQQHATEEVTIDRLGNEVDVKFWKAKASQYDLASLTDLLGEGSAAEAMQLCSTHYNASPEADWVFQRANHCVLSAFHFIVTSWENKQHLTRLERKHPQL